MTKKTVIVDMSGGVDSSTACFLLQREGYRVIGVTLKLWESQCDDSVFNKKSCCGADDLTDARKIASQLKIPYYVLNCEKEFKDNIIEHFCDEYLKGRTPSPCILCNQKIKFDVLLRRAQKEFKADYIATGHYAQIVYNKINKEYELHKGHDKDKDQSYFLWGLTQRIMPYLLFPIGKYNKSEIRKIALDAGLVVASKKESQEICFIPDGNYGKFLLNYKKIKTIPGNIIDVDGKHLGTHQGLHFYTIGQRKGLGISSPSPLYVISIDLHGNILVVGKEKSLYNNRLIAENIIWCTEKPFEEPITIKAKIRSRGPEADAMLHPHGRDKAELFFLSSQRAITSGQAVVFYDKSKVIGGGWII
ncbi:MAG: tRNA 2-thiouridine(34) synthase MnmA [Candidatus Firestonebacteria bacterium]|nr:tRNA 2-thiouridine(34) synthase MnmA [Candidatus Firestonebacteria bacterium]